MTDSTLGIAGLVVWAVVVLAIILVVYFARQGIDRED